MGHVWADPAPKTVTAMMQVIWHHSAKCPYRQVTAMATSVTKGWFTPWKMVFSMVRLHDPLFMVRLHGPISMVSLLKK